MQLAKVLAPGLRVIATAGSDESTAWVRGLGADDVISHRSPFKPALAALGVHAVEYIFCCHDTAPVWAQLAELVAPQGSINTIGLMPGAGATLDVWPLYMKSATLSA